MTTVYTCEQTLSFVASGRQAEVAPDSASAVAGHLLACDDCRTGILSCDRALSLMDAVRPGRIDGASAVALAAHLVACDACRGRAESMRAVQAILETLDAPSSLAERLARAGREHLAREVRARTFETPFGWNALAYSDGGIVLVERSLEGPDEARDRLRERLGEFILQQRRRDDIGESAVRKLLDYYRGRRVRFDEPIDLHLVPAFTQDVLRTTARIPYGQVRPYAWVAREVGKPRATRAVGQALHINPVAPIIPCHRVIASDNTLGGYGGGLEMKRWLLKLEGYLD